MSTPTVTYIVDIEGEVLRVTEGSFHGFHSEVFVSLVGETHQDPDNLSCGDV